MNLKIIFKIEPQAFPASDRCHNCDKFGPDSRNCPAFCIVPECRGTRFRTENDLLLTDAKC